ncbi:MAG: hypothetical protein JO332_17230 [Planctomycetaceae bacterium]|nr:hypothetical protein [Planctomycetaceae bacterium]
MSPAAPWLARLGAVLLLLSPFLPQAETGGRTVGAWSMLAALAGQVGGVECLAIAGGLYLPVLTGALLLAGAWRPGAGPAVLRLAQLCLLLLVSFALATLGSLLLTDAATRSTAPSFPLSVALFALPLLLSGAALARWMQGGLDRATGTYERGALGLLLLLHGLFLADCGWAYLLLPGGASATVGVRPLATAWIGPLGAGLSALGALASRLPPRAAVDTAPASG